jgi:kinesin family member 5
MSSASSNSHAGGAGKKRPNSSANADSIKVICRFRPPRAPKKDAKTGKAQAESFKLNHDNGEIAFVSDFHDSKSFKFDRVFGGESTQSDIFEEVSSSVDYVMSGFNGAILAYGQTSAGKSWTMEGPSIWDTNNQGVVPRFIHKLFDEIEKAPETTQFQLVVSFYEIYCEKVRDLLNPAQVNMKIRETKTDGFIVQDVTEIYCTDKDSVLRVIEMGKTNRIAAPTLMNAESSRSHSIFSILVDQQDIASGRHKKGWCVRLLHCLSTIRFNYGCRSCYSSMFYKVFCIWLIWLVLKRSARRVPKACAWRRRRTSTAR